MFSVPAESSFGMQLLDKSGKRDKVLARLLIPHPYSGQITARKSAIKTAPVLQLTPGSPKSVSRNSRVQWGPRTDSALLAGWPVRLNAECIPAGLEWAFILLYSKIATAHMALADICKTRKQSNFTAVGALGSGKEGGAGEGCACRLRIHEVPVRDPACARKALGDSCRRGLSPPRAAAGDAWRGSTSTTSHTPNCPERRARSGKLSTSHYRTHLTLSYKLLYQPTVLIAKGRLLVQHK